MLNKGKQMWEWMFKANCLYNLIYMQSRSQNLEWFVRQKHFACLIRNCANFSVILNSKTYSYLQLSTYPKSKPIWKSHAFRQVQPENHLIKNQYWNFQNKYKRAKSMSTFCWKKEQKKTHIYAFLVMYIHYMHKCK